MEEERESEGGRKRGWAEEGEEERSKRKVPETKADEDERGGVRARA